MRSGCWSGWAFSLETGGADPAVSLHGLWNPGQGVAGVPAVVGLIFGKRPAPQVRYTGLLGQLTLSAVSSTTKEVCSETSSVPVNFSVMVWPM
jgi:hypothetical protein